ncbi:hypothetical protein SKAU_G00045070 [Synaphobranchus kaupii]|uniref:Uncharacterized protein n=1 Tax=Synaphobranchus kaupii TaxID=118154 RepID=A0A9Q1G1X3_SYNKA|nr:hypothetical protein SKAU_G00045070 [Synaphobranchus kaupii]
MAGSSYCDITPPILAWVRRLCGGSLGAALRKQAEGAARFLQRFLPALGRFPAGYAGVDVVLPLDLGLGLPRDPVPLSALLTLHLEQTGRG